MQVLDHRPGDAQPVICRCPAPYLIEDDERAVGGVVQDVGRLIHLDHERRVPPRQVVAGADAREDPVHNAKPAGGCRVANRVRGPRKGSRCRCSTTAQAMLSPSYVDVPRPISSRMMSERSVALFRMLAVSFISTMNVEFPLARSSLAPTREKILSTMPNRQEDAGTHDPTCAMRTMSATWRM